MLRGRALLLVSLLASCGGGGVDESGAGPSQPDVVVVMLDTTRADHLGFLSGAAPSPTPFLDRLAALSIVFENAWTASTCTAPSTASVFTGLQPVRHGVETNLLARAGPLGEGESARERLAHVELVALPGTVPTLTEHLAAAGYQTLGIGANPNFCAALGFARGFDLFSEHASRDARAMAGELRRLARKLDRARPTFTYLHFMDPHAPYEQRRPWCLHEGAAGCSADCRYRSEISFLDAELERIFAKMGWLDDALVIVVTDHGEEFLDHGGVMHRYSVHQELARAGLLLRFPGLAPARSSQPAHHTDLLPTILALLGLPPPATLDGRALVPAPAGEPERALLTCRLDPHKGRQLFGLTLGQWRLIEDEPSGTVRLYDLGRDPAELRDLAAQRPELVAELRERLARLRADLSPLPRQRVTVDLTESLNEELVKLGYADDEH